ncbi:MAG TPA: DUF4832 domain-containing protein [Planctomycetota bacterium]|nr:DUF4832 domain-containing protein [Planctomycetota bacterium]
MSESPTSTPNDRSWRAGFSPDQTIQRVRPAEDHGWLPNPHRGTTTFQRFNGDKLYPGLAWSDREGPLVFKPFDGRLGNERYPDTTLSYCRWLWSVLEPRRGEHRWDVIEQALAAGRARGQTVQMRVQPYIGGDIPAWYWELGGQAQPRPEPVVVADPGPFGAPGTDAEPDHNHPAYLEHFGGFIRAFGERFDGHPDLESFDIAYGGGCGEGGGNATPDTAARLVDIYLDAFRRTPLMSMLGTPGCRHAARHRRVGWRADCFGDLHPEGLGRVPDGLNWNHMHDLYPREVRDCGVAETWKTAPVTLETCWTVGYWHKQGWDLDWILAQGLKYHASVFMPKSSSIPDEWRDKIDAFDRRLGYRLVVRQAMLPMAARRGASLAWSLTVENVGVAPLYRPYRLALRYRQGDTAAVVALDADPREWLPGDAVLDGATRVPPTLRPGVAAIDLGLIDAADEARVLFANQRRRDDRWLALTHIELA